MGFVKKICLIVVAASWISGCSTVNIPSYIPDKKPYVTSYYASYEEAMVAIEQSLKEFGWVIENTTDPSIYERSGVSGAERKQTLIITSTRQTALFIGSRYYRMNILVREQIGNQTEIEVRYVTVNSLPFKSFYSYKKDGFVKKFFKQIESHLPQ